MVTTITPATCTKIELEIAIDAPRETVWAAIFEDVNLWWHPAFRVMGENSTVTFDPQPGGRGLVESTEDGGLLWFTVQMYLPSQFKIYTFGHIAQDWGGPMTSTLSLSLQETEAGCLLQVSDARFGNVDDQQTQTFLDGWNLLFGDGLKKFVESK